MKIAGKFLSNSKVTSVIFLAIVMTLFTFYYYVRMVKVLTYGKLNDTRIVLKPVSSHDHQFEELSSSLEERRTIILFASNTKIVLIL